MSLIQMLLQEMELEAQTTRKMLERVPADKYDWQPHQKSMILWQLATHVAELPSWVSMTLTTDELDFASNSYQTVPIQSKADLMHYFERSLAEGKEELRHAQETQLSELWTLRNGNEVYSTSTKGEVIRMSYSQIVHHRAYLRLLDIPIPGSYDPSAEEIDLINISSRTYLD